MHQQANKYLEAFSSLAQQITTVLTNKQLEQVQMLTDKCISNLAQYDKLSFYKLLSSFLQLFLFCPNNYSEIFYKKYYAILKDGFQSKSKNYITEKYELLLNCLIEIAEKHYAPLYFDIKSQNINKPLKEYLEPLMNINIKGHLNLKGFLFLFKKNIQRDKENYKNVDLFSIVKQLYFRMAGDMQEDVKKNAVMDNYSFRWFFVSNILEHLNTKMQSQIGIYKQYFKTYLTKSFDENVNLSHKNIAFMLFMVLNKQQVFSKQIIDSLSNQQSNISHEFKEEYRSLFLNILISGCLLGALNEILMEKNLDYIISLIIILQRRYFVSYEALSKNGNIRQSLSSRQNLLFEEFVYEHLLKMKKNLSESVSFKTSYEKILQTMNKNSCIMPESIFLNEKTKFKLFQTEFYQCMIKQKEYLTKKAKIYLATIYWFMITKNQHSYEVALLFQQKLYKQYSKIINNQQNLQLWQTFFRQLCLGMPFLMPLQNMITIIFGSTLKKQQKNNIFKAIRQYYDTILQQKISSKEIQTYLQNNQKRIQADTYELQDILQLVDFIFKDTIEKKEQSSELQSMSHINPLSIVLFDKLNIRPYQVFNKQEEITFIKRKAEKKSIFIQAIIKFLYRNDDLLKNNKSLIKSLSFTEGLPEEKLITLILKKYFTIYYSKINEYMLKKWMMNKQLALIWTMLFSNYKVKSICDQLLKLNNSIQEYRCFFNLEQEVIKQFMEYLATKDRYKFRLSLAFKQLYHHEDLVNYHLPDIIS